MVPSQEMVLPTERTVSKAICNAGLVHCHLRSARGSFVECLDIGSIAQVLGSFELPHFGRYRVMYEDENLGSYAAPRAAVDELCGGSTLVPRTLIETSHCGLPVSLSEWNFVLSRTR